MSATISDAATESLIEAGLALFEDREYAEAHARFRAAFAIHSKEIVRQAISATQADIEDLIWDRLKSLMWRRKLVLWVALMQQSNDGRSTEDLIAAYNAKPLVERTDWNRKVVQALPEFVRAAISDVIHEAVAAADSLPWRYEVFVSLPLNGLAEWIQEGVEFEGGRIGRISNDEQRAYDLSSIEQDLEFMCPVPSAWGEGYYLITQLDGYVSDSSRRDGSVPAAARERLKSIVGLCLACEVLNADPESDAMDLPEPIFIFKQNAEDEGYVRWLPKDEDAVFGRLRPCLPDGTAAEAHLRRQWHGITAALRRRDDRMLNVCRWLFESYCGSNQLLQLVQANVVLEIVLGDKKESSEVGISKLLANRAAYLIANSAPAREKLLAEIKEIYDARSRIVHAGRNDLGGDSDKLDQMRWICRRVIQRELSLLNAL